MEQNRLLTLVSSGTAWRAPPRRLPRSGGRDGAMDPSSKITTAQQRAAAAAPVQAQQ